MTITFAPDTIGAQVGKHQDRLTERDTDKRTPRLADRVTDRFADKLTARQPVFILYSDVNVFACVFVGVCITVHH